jgi:Mce-associated membrane protein
VYLQGTTGYSVGKSVVGIRTTKKLDEYSGDNSLGTGGVLLRELAHCADTVPLFIGWLWAVRDSKRQTFADKLTGSVVRGHAPNTSTGQQRARRMTLAALTVMTLALVAVPTVQYFHQYEPESATSAIADSAAQRASDSAVALLSYKADTVDGDLSSAASLLTGDFLDYYSRYTEQVVAPTAKEKGVTTQASVSGAAVTDVTSESATVIVFIDQSTTTSDKPEPSTTASTVRVTLSDVEGRWLVSAFDPM